VSLHAHVVGGDLKPLPQESPLTSHASFTFVRCDVTVWADLLALFDAAIQKYGRVDHVFANAGIATRAGDEYFADNFSAEGVLQEPKHPMLAVNLMGAANTLKLGVYHLRKNSQGGSLVANASAAGKPDLPLLRLLPLLQLISLFLIAFTSYRG
jgi:NAD(P)-dependent dehydrogenase (short-subunit alcohol dehydrogenase family)